MSDDGASPVRAVAASPVAPGDVVGILGGGQLGRMLALAAARLGLKTRIYAPEGDAPAADVAAGRHIGRYDDAAELTAFAAECAVVTLEFENVPVEALEIIQRTRPVRPGLRALATAQDRLVEKQFLRDAGLDTVAFHAVETAADLAEALAETGGAGILKTRRLGYDGKGQVRIAGPSEAPAAIEALNGAPAILEAKAAFERELSVIVARGLDGSIAAYDPAENRHEDGILATSAVPGGLSPDVAAAARAQAARVADALDYVGVLGVEFFELAEGRLLVNEIAPRVHNSGHWTLEACVVSQFEQHIRAICGWPLGDPVRHSDAVMTNLIGEHAADWARLAADPGAALHLYGKAEIRPGRKMGHVTRLL